MTGPTRYVTAGRELGILRCADSVHLPVMILGPTGCGKTRLVEHLAAELARPLVTITCHDDLTTADLVGRLLVKGGDVTWIDGPLTAAVRTGAVCYLDEVIEARRDTLAALHSLADHRRTLYLERTNEEVSAPEGFFLVCSYNPRAKGAFKELRPSLRQRFVTLELEYLPPEQEAAVVCQETGVDRAVAERLVAFAASLRQSFEPAMNREAASTRLLVNTASLVAAGLSLEEAVETALLKPLQPNSPTEAAFRELLRASGPPTR